MGTGGWIIIAIIVIQAIAGGVAKIVESRKAGGKGTTKPGGSRPAPKLAARVSTRAKLDALRQHRVAALKTPTPAPTPMPTVVPIVKVQSPPPPTKKRKTRKVAARSNAPRSVTPLVVSEAIAKTVTLGGSIHAGAHGSLAGQTDPTPPQARSIGEMLSSGERFRDAILFAEIIAPPLALRPEQVGGHLDP
jgi:hypothetical protein